MNVFVREMKAHRKSLILWSVGLLFMIASGMTKYSSYSGSGQSLNLVLDKMPKTLKAILGFGTLDVTTVSGFYGMLFLYLLIMVSIHACMLGANIIAKEERDKTTEFLMVKPISRSGIITAKLIAALVNVLVLNLVTLTLSIAIVSKYGKGESVVSEIGILMIGMFIMQLLFLFVGTGIASAGRNPKHASALSTTVLLITFIISAVVDMNSSLEPLKYITPFKYFEAQRIMENGGVEPLSLVLSSVVIALMLVITYTGFRKRDLKI